MNFIKIGDRYINLDNVTRIEPLKAYPGTLEIEFIGRNSEDWGSTWVEGEEAEALCAWLAHSSADITGRYPLFDSARRETGAAPNQEVG